MYKRYEGETDSELIYRITSAKEQIGTWQDVADILNDLLGTNYTESAFRKKKQAFDVMFLANEDKFADMQRQLDELREQRIELEKAKVKFRDERAAYNKLIRQEARKESYTDLVLRLLTEHTPAMLCFPGYMQDIKGTTDLIVHLTDIHAGISIDNAFNCFNMDILRNRFNEYISRIYEIRNRHDSENVYVIISEIISGLIHENLRIENNENLIEQFLTVSDYISEFLTRLAIVFNNVYVYVCPGNHSRVSPKKEQNLKGENFDNLLIPFLRAKLQNYENIQCYDNDIEESICCFTVRGNVVMGSHGDKDSPNNVVEKFSLLYNTVPQIIYLGHRHRNAMHTIHNTKVIESGSMCGVDNYALDLRLSTKPEQTVSVIDEDGLICLYDIQLNA